MVGDHKGFETKSGYGGCLCWSKNSYSRVIEEYVANCFLEAPFKGAHPSVVALPAHNFSFNLDFATVVSHELIALHDSFRKLVSLTRRKHLKHPIAEDMLAAVSVTPTKSTLLNHSNNLAA